ncbi:MAG: WG repeat-containing protein [Clostridia bacterium]|nr:WG repeat-containing protein [Clostridia bacterium]
MKRILASALCLLLLCAPALAETYAVDIYGSEESPAYSILLRDDGTLLTPIKTCNSIYQLTPSGTPDAQKLFSVTPVNVDIAYTPEAAEELLYDMNSVRVALMNGEGRLLTGFDYDYLDYADGYVIFALPDALRHTGAMDAAGNVVIQPEYGALRPMAGGAWLALTLPEDADADDPRCGVAYIDAGGEVRDLGLHTGSRYINLQGGDIAVLGDVDEYDGKSVYIDSNGEVLFGRQYRYAEPFVGRYAVVEEENGRYGVIDATGATVLYPEFDYINSEAGKPIIAVREAYYAAYDPEDFALLAEQDLTPAESVSVTPITATLLGVSTGERTWIRTTGGQVLMEVPQDKSVMMYCLTGDDINRLVQEDRDWPRGMSRLIDLNGNAASGEFRLITVGCWEDGQGRFITGDFRIYKDVGGEEMVDWTSYRYGLIDGDGHTLLPQVYDELRALSFDRYWAVQGDRSGMIDAEGNWYYVISDYVSLMD